MCQLREHRPKTIYLDLEHSGHKEDTNFCCLVIYGSMFKQPEFILTSSNAILSLVLISHWDELLKKEEPQEKREKGLGCIQKESLPESILMSTPRAIHSL